MSGNIFFLTKEFVKNKIEAPGKIRNKVLKSQ